MASWCEFDAFRISLQHRIFKSISEEGDGVPSAEREEDRATSILESEIPSPVK